MPTIRHILHRLLVAIGMLMLLQQASLAQSSPDRISVTQQPGSYVLTVPASRLSLAVPSDRLVQGNPRAGGATNNPRYFFFSDEARGLVISGWFEPASQFPGADSAWQADLAASKKNGLPPPTDVSSGKVNDWAVVFYEQQLPGISNSHVRAHYVRAGTWIDVHISVTTLGAGNSNRETVTAVLNSLAVSEKKSQATP
ncbi:hypothetical protein ABL840_24530 [Variovorax sp. NFACC27]|uniref:hypothetical protein n=1 Tax=unclassified Variovorax TaxID=663243 RepID=UPI00089BAB12|nr:hypothetical protein SAMN03159371_05757 [Variovorax sp. NFACC28]SEG91767.1 hypothetical protein SAMN03159365_05578 [Variovorax sp. NFACC29]SFD51688.1 hypothetical protein SAMN03159379_05503 [Variovorax sp. NFACC26]SFG71350.1 hypothetical protein SAMN03159447_04533 [Variovorax sp. NFACC27]